MTNVSPLLILQALAEARALLYQLDDFDDLAQAVDPLWQYACDHGVVDQIGEQAAASIIREAFKGIAEL